METTPGPPNLLRPLFRLYFRRLVPLLGQLIAGDESAYTYLPESTLAFLEPSRLAAVLRQRGLVDIIVRRLALGTVAVTVARKPAA
jgi:demethylmenaquinone methyltransferase/2-methoxy-6-polyprenyl-1,4-benzoquinol methylase